MLSFINSFSDFFLVQSLLTLSIYLSHWKKKRFYCLSLPVFLAYVLYLLKLLLTFTSFANVKHASIFSPTSPRAILTFLVNSWSQNFSILTFVFPITAVSKYIFPRHFACLHLQFLPFIIKQNIKSKQNLLFISWHSSFPRQLHY